MGYSLKRSNIVQQRTMTNQTSVHICRLRPAIRKNLYRNQIIVLGFILDLRTSYLDPLQTATSHVPSLWNYATMERH